MSFIIFALMFSVSLSGVAMAASAHAADITILHVNDHHSHLRANSRMNLDLGGESTRVVSGGFPAVVSKIRDLSEGRDDVLTLHAGDAITGDLYYTLFKGAADAAMMNMVCFDAFVLGNHEFDHGDAGLKDFLDMLKTDDCATPVLAANVRPEVGVSPLAMNSTKDYIQPYTIKKINGREYGIIGINIAEKTKKSSNPDATTMFDDEAKTAQKYIKELTEKGVARIILLTHHQYLNDLAMAKELTGADVIIGGDSHTLLGDAFEDVGLTPTGSYPTLVKGADGNDVCVAQAWEYSQIVGELNVRFDENGAIAACDGIPHMPITDSFKRKNAEGNRVELEGEARDKAKKLVEDHPYISIMATDEDTKTMLAGFSAKVEELEQEVIGEVAENICLERVPGQGKSSLCSPEETSKHGGSAANLVAHAFRNMSKQSDIAIQNAGGVRADIPAGKFTIGQAYRLLPFANTLVNLEMTGAEIKQVLEEAVEFATKPSGSTGAYPYAAGLRWVLDMTKDAGNRITHLEFKGREDFAWVTIDPDTSYTVVTNSYIGGGKDGYVTFGNIAKDERITDTYLDYAQSFVDYVRGVKILRKLDASEYSTQDVIR